MYRAQEAGLPCPAPESRKPKVKSQKSKETGKLVVLFWIVATLLAAAVTATLVVPLLRAPSDAAVDASSAIYRDQLAEVDRDVARGLLDAEEAERARTEIARRLLDADRTLNAHAGKAPKAANIVASAAAAAVLVAGTVALYDRLGVPGYPDVPRADRIAASEAFRANRMSQAEAEALAAPSLTSVPDDALDDESRTILTQLREVMPRNPDELRGWQLLADLEVQLGNFGAAARAQEQVIAIKGEEVATEDLAFLADIYVDAAGGIVSPETESLLRTILEEDDGNFAARYYFGLLYYQTDRPDVAFRFWRDLAEQGPIASPHVRLARAGVEDAAFRAGVDYGLPDDSTTAAPGPDAADMAAMADLSPEDRAAMIGDMVARLADRIDTQGGPVEEWARLINAYAVLGETEQARDVLRRAYSEFNMDPVAVDLLDTVAGETGIME